MVRLTHAHTVDTGPFLPRARTAREGPGGRPRLADGWPKLWPSGGWMRGVIDPGRGGH